MADTVYQYAVGLEIVLDCGQDIAGADRPVIVARLPSGVERQWPASIVNLDSGASWVGLLSGKDIK